MGLILEFIAEAVLGVFIEGSLTAVKSDRTNRWVRWAAWLFLVTLTLFIVAIIALLLYAGIRLMEQDWLNGTFFFVLGVLFTVGGLFLVIKKLRTERLEKKNHE